jgi:hypothetical protein
MAASDLMKGNAKRGKKSSFKNDNFLPASF